ncbi:MAG: hypothetical protein A2174_02455 [Candidatus Portnoybacteria bacterium RBG_13_41_18]|uniref:phosphoribosylaminoimidazolesuccinocarboxamide synthase n=1 Tax=Candidatus Portnoybacteria bacterium RBG_13_41_18 TaxID=1801991 RepID=A0A1G2FA30_9BACT|nr:MAG: hypothetical protein A2174_02455 [Candidatus Portnoybacteria bacterium RBG_13_41_18]
MNPLNTNPVFEVNVEGLQELAGERKVRRMFVAPDRRLLDIATDRIGAFDQPHVTEKGEPAHYAGKGIILTEFSKWGKKEAMFLMPTDYIDPEPYKELIPEEYRDRLSVHEPAQEAIKFEFICRTGCEGSMAEKAAQGKLVCGQELPKGLALGDVLPRPYFTPTTKAPKGQKDQDILIQDYLGLFRDEEMAQYLYGMTVLLHLRNKWMARICGLDRPDQKMEFFIFDSGMPNNYQQSRFDWSETEVADTFGRFCLGAGLAHDSWREMPGFDLAKFCGFAKKNQKSGQVRLGDEFGSTDDGRYRSLQDTFLGRKLMKDGKPDLAMAFLLNYLCKEFFRTVSKETGQGGYEKKASQKVVVPDWVLAETSKRNLRALLMLTQGK